MQDILYFENQSVDSKLIYQVGFLWQKINQNIDKVLLPYNLNTAKFNILMVIKHSGSEFGIKQNEISEQLLTTKSNITKMLDKLEADGLISRNFHKNDKRIKLIKITKEGSELLDKVWEKYISCIEKTAPKLPESRKKQLLDALSFWNNEINKN